MSQEQDKPIEPGQIKLEAVQWRNMSLLIAIGACFLLLPFTVAAVAGWPLRRVLTSYLTSFGFYASLSIGALFFVAIQHACRAGWSVTVRRVAELLACTILVSALLFIPVLIAVWSGTSVLYDWADAKLVAENVLLSNKRPYLNPSFFTLRAVVYLAIWSWLAWFFLQRSACQDETGRPELTLAMERMSYPAIILLGLSMTFASFDWFMSLMPEWYSTIFGVYYFSGAAVGSLAAIVLLLIAFQLAGFLNGVVTADHYHDLGKLLFGFVIFWGYIAFSQYMLIWYGNIPEETTWYQIRQQGGWIAVSLLLLFGHLIIPFFGLLSRESKRNKVRLGFWAAWLLIFHWLDMYYLIMPHAGVPEVPFGVTELSFLVGMGLLHWAGFRWLAGRVSLVPVNDPRLPESLAVEAAY